jgi:hypothetical protein
MRKMGQDSKNPTNFCKYSNARVKKGSTLGKKKQSEEARRNQCTKSNREDVTPTPIVNLNVLE